MFHRDAFNIVGMDPTYLWPNVKERPPPVMKFSGNPPPYERKGMHLVGVNGTLGEIDDFVDEEEEDLGDALSDQNDMLKIAPSWWILECIPQQIRFQTDDDSWVRKLSINRGRGRVIPKQRAEGVKIHRTVKLRMEMKQEGKGLYKPRAGLINGIVATWVD